MREYKDYKDYNVNVKIEITPQILAKIFWEMYDDEQADFFNNLSVLASISEIEEQLYHVKKSDMLTESGKEVMSRFGEL